MRYHKAIAISAPEANYIIMRRATSLNAWAVIEHFGQWYDIRRMTKKEVEDFVSDLKHARNADVAAGRLTPH